MGNRKLKTGNYKLEVIAEAPRRLSSETASYEFFVKPTVAELAGILKPSSVKGSDPVPKRTSRIVPSVEHVATAKMFDR